MYFNINSATKGFMVGKKILISKVFYGTKKLQLSRILVPKIRETLFFDQLKNPARNRKTSAVLGD